MEVVSGGPEFVKEVRVGFKNCRDHRGVVVIVHLECSGECCGALRGGVVRSAGVEEAESCPPQATDAPGGTTCMVQVSRVGANVDP